MDGDESTQRQHLREDGRQIHKRETRRQIILPFVGGLLLILGAFLLMALPTDPAWRLRASAVNDWLYLVLCQVPFLVCSLITYFVVIAGIWGMNKLHSGTERPLVKLENLVAGLASRVESIAGTINERTLSWRAKAEQILHVMRIFDQTTNSDSDTTERETS